MDIEQCVIAIKNVSSVPKNLSWISKNVSSVSVSKRASWMMSKNVSSLSKNKSWISKNEAHSYRTTKVVFGRLWGSWRVRDKSGAKNQDQIGK